MEDRKMKRLRIMSWKKLRKTTLCVLLVISSIVSLFPALGTEAEATSNSDFYAEVTKRIDAYMTVCEGRYWNNKLSKEELMKLEN